MHPAAWESRRIAARRLRLPSLVALFLFALPMAACGPQSASPPASDADPGSSYAHAGGDDHATALPAHAPDRFGFGAAAAPDRIALWDIDVRPDGAGLPLGSGSVALGREVYERSCVQCHGPTGTEGPNDRLVTDQLWEQWPPGRAIGAFWPYATTLFDYTRRAMPQLQPGTLSADEVYGVVAYVLHLNGILPEDAELDAESLPTIEMPARDRFVPDNRTGGPTIR